MHTTIFINTDMIEQCKKKNKIIIIKRRRKKHAVIFLELNLLCRVMEPQQRLQESNSMRHDDDNTSRHMFGAQQSRTRQLNNNQ